MTNASITRKLFWLERPQKHYADQVRHPGGGHGVRGDGAVVLAVHALQLVHGPKLGYFLLGLGYCSAALALWMLYNLYMFLARIEKEEVFTPANVLALRRISWCCTWAAALCLPVGAVLGLPFIFAIGVAAAFMALIVRVIKNAFAQAVKMKDELDYTV
jgi:O-antigen/teichoic acid export membrane protein